MPFVYFVINISNASFTTPLPFIRIYNIFKNNLPSVKNIIIFKSKNIVMNPLLFILIVGWSMLISFTVPKFIKNEELKYGVTLMLNSMSLGVYLGVTIGALFF
jgi:uncharacterized membrane protein YwzB